MQLVCRLRSEHLERDQRSTEDNATGEDSTAAASAAASDSLVVEVRLFDKAGGKDAGMCTLNLNFRSEGEDGTATSSKVPCMLGYSKQAEAQRNPEGSAIASAPWPAAAPAEASRAAEARAGGLAEAVDHRKSSLILVEETARHIEEIKEVQFLGLQDEVRLPP